MATVKNNLSVFAPTLGFEIMGMPVPVEGGPAEDVAVARWTGQLDLSADDLMSRKKSQQPAEAFAQAEAFLQQALANGPRPKADIVRDARELGISERTLHRALKQVGQSDGNPKGATWRLDDPDQFRPDEPPADLTDLTDGGGEREDD
jgi:hypothetical protein